MKGWSLSLLLAIWLVPTAGAEPIIDQQFLANGNFGIILDYPDEYLAQTFTARHGGQLVGIGVQVSLWGYSNYLPVTDDLLVRLVKTDAAGVPVIDEVLASHVIDRSLVPVFLPEDEVLEIDLTDRDLLVQAGDVLAIALSSDHTLYSQPGSYYQYEWHGRPLNPHPGGDYYAYSPTEYGPTPYLVRDSHFDPLNNTRDMAFRVIINVPEPVSFLLMVTGLVMLAPLGVTRRCRKLAS